MLRKTWPFRACSPPIETSNPEADSSIVTSSDSKESSRSAVSQSSRSEPCSQPRRQNSSYAFMAMIRSRSSSFPGAVATLVSTVKSGVQARLHRSEVSPGPVVSARICRKNRPRVEKARNGAITFRPASISATISNNHVLPSTGKTATDLRHWQASVAVFVAASLRPALRGPARFFGNCDLGVNRAGQES
jgi:hypothetical protein